jgi:hypothetical protein
MVKRAPARSRPGKLGTKGLVPAECQLDQATGVAGEVFEAIEEAGGCVVGSYKEPLGGHPVLRERAAKFNVEKIKPQDLAGAPGPPDED